MAALDSVIAAAAMALPEGQLTQLVRALETLGEPGPTTRAILESSAMGSAARHDSESIAAAWAEQTEMTGSLALAASQRCIRNQRRTNS